MRSWILGVLLALVGQGAVLGCGSGESAVSCDEESCECRNREVCNLDCGEIMSCEPSCLGFDSACDAVCMDDCEFDCRGGDRIEGVCRGECGENCNASCGSVGSCIVEAGSDSEYTCVNAINCAATLGDGSIANCINVSGTCGVRCLGECQVFCDLTENCNVDCDNQDRRICDTGYIICGPECPPNM